MGTSFQKKSSWKSNNTYTVNCTLHLEEGTLAHSSRNSTWGFPLSYSFQGVKNGITWGYHKKPLSEASGLVQSDLRTKYWTRRCPQSLTMGPGILGFGWQQNLLLSYLSLPFGYQLEHGGQKGLGVLYLTDPVSSKLFYFNFLSTWKIHLLRP